MVELLSPAGNMEKMKAAILYGADAVYLAGQSFGMRASAGNFSLEELRVAVAYAHARNVRVYLTLNVMPRQYEYPALRTYIQHLATIPLDACIVADLGVLALVREMLPHMAIHISTQANVVSAAACRAYHALGATRIVLAREVTLDEIRAIRQDIPKDLQLEAFVHGSMCISYSGRCLLSSHFTGRDANRGQCTQPCRWKYSLHELAGELVEEKRPEMPVPVVESQGETFFMSSKDTCMIAHVPELLEAGIDSFKIEGRMKSAYYTAAVTNTYRMAIRAAEQGGIPYQGSWMRELESVSHRPYHTGYYYDDCHTLSNTTDTYGYIGEKAYLATVLSYDPETGVACLLQKNKFSQGDTVELLTPGQIGRSFVVQQLWDEAHMTLSSVPHPQMQFYMPVPFPVHAGDILRAGT